MDERDWRILSILHKEKNITKTAQDLYISQPALTARIQQIEKYFDVTIVNRNRKGVSFTTEGEYLAQEAEHMLSEFKGIKEHVLNLGTRMSGVLSIGASGYLTMFTIPKVLKKFKTQYPDIDFQVVTTWSRDVTKLVEDQKVHVGFTSADYGGCVEKYVLCDEPICIASMALFSLEELPNIPRIDYKTDTLVKLQIDQWWRDHFSIPSKTVMQVDRLTTCREMIKAGLGYGIVPAHIMRDTQGIRMYYLRDRNGAYIYRKSYLLYKKNVLELQIAKVFIDFMKAYDFK
jgi:DNA-binding transcriptional LysR family regulator